MLICVTGSGYISRRAARELIADFMSPFNESEEWLLPSYLTSDGLRNVKYAIDEYYGENSTLITRQRKQELTGYLLRDQSAVKILLILDAGSEPDLVKSALDNDIAIYDLSKALYPVVSLPPSAQIPLDSSVSDVEALTASPVRDDTLQNSSTAESITEPHGWDSLNDKQRKEAEEVIASIIARDNFGEHVKHLEDVVTVTEPLNFEPLIESMPEETTAYYKSKRGKYRKAGKSKARPGEELVYLNQEEISKL